MLKAATDVVTAFGRVRDLEDHARVLGQAAEVMDASGLMVWVGGTAATTRPVPAHGYTEEQSRGSPCAADSPTTPPRRRIRSGAMQIVPSRRPGASGAVVAPILTAGRCIWRAVGGRFAAAAKRRRASRRSRRSSRRSSRGAASTAPGEVQRAYVRRPTL